MSRALLRRSAAAALTTLMLSALVACGGDDEPDAADDTASPSESASSAESPATEETEETADEPAEGESMSPAEFTDLYRAAFDEATTAHIEMNASSAAGDMTGEGEADYTTTPPSMSMTMSGAMMGGADAEVRMLDGVMYMKMAMLGDKWIKFDLNDPSNPLGTAFADQMDPRAMMDTFEKGVTAATYVGEEDVDGETMRRYEVVLDTAVLLESLDPKVRAQAEGSMPDSVTYDLWFDEDGLYRRMDFDLGANAGSTSMTFSDWGEPVSIEAPDPSEVTSMPGTGGQG